MIKDKSKNLPRSRKKSDVTDNFDSDSEDDNKEYTNIDKKDIVRFEKQDDSEGDIDIYPDDTDDEDSDSAEEVEEDDVELKDHQTVDPYIQEEKIKQKFPFMKFIEYQYRVPDEERRTSNYLSLFEATQILSMRISMIQQKSISMVSNDNLSYAQQIARKELFERKIPLKIKRIVGIDDKKRILYELWDPKTMALPHI